ncbi:MAG: hypothetical protein Q7T82_01320 [Armatimonadota bacterium]|nr:hypothetical protein [Armatimonadota bacterium]
MRYIHAISAQTERGADITAELLDFDCPKSAIRAFVVNDGESHPSTL